MLCKVDMCFRRVFVALSAAMAAAHLFAAEVTAQQAETAVNRWLVNAPSLGCRLGGTVESVRTCTATNGAQFHVARVAGGGFVVTSADTTLAPIVAFASGGDLEENDANPLWVLLRRDFAARAQSANPSNAGRRKAGAGMSSAAQTENEARWARLLGGGTRMMSANGDGTASVSDLRVAPLVQSQWGQETTIAGGDCFNYYTPNNYPCGCVATAGAQIMRYFMWPEANVTIPQFTNPHCSISNAETVVVRNITLTTQGGSYDWSMMPLVPNATTSDAERRAIGKLTSDIGICSSMSYSPDGSGAGGYMLAETFTNHFGYASALAAQWRTGDQSGSDAFKNALLSNFDAGLPVMLGLYGASGGHAIVGDGYGYSDGALFIHMNFGWTGIGDAWYSPPDLDTGYGAFNVIDGFVFNILPQLPPSTVICSGRVLDDGGNPVAGAQVTWRQSGAATGSGSAVETDGKGIYALMLQPGSYVVTASYGALSSSISVTLQANRATRTEPPDKYYYSPAPSIGNRCGKDIVISGVSTVAMPQFDPPSCLFYPATNVTITCATPGATIRYTLDGTEPTPSSAAYTGPIAISDDATITAKAWADGMNPSVAVSATYTYDASQGAPKGDYFADPIVISGTNGSRIVQDNSAYTVEAGEPLHTLDGGVYYSQYHTIWYEWTAPGSGTMTFRTRCISESYYGSAVAVYEGSSLASLTRLLWDAAPSGYDYFNTVMLNVSQGTTYRIVGIDTMQPNGETREFTLTWSGDLAVAPTATPNTPEPVPYSWLQNYFPGNHSSAEYDAMALLDSDCDGYLNWEEYVLQTNPTNAASGLKASIRMEGGVPHVEYTPSTFLSGYHAVIKGTDDLGAPPVDWVTVTGPAAAYHFFKVVVVPDD